MGRSLYSKRMEVEQYRRFDIYWLKQNRYLTVENYPYNRTGAVSWKHNDSGRDFILNFSICTLLGNSYIELTYIQDQKDALQKKYQQKLTLNTTTCNYGKYRYWYICSCGKRVGVIYCRSYSFLCRNCHNLTYKKRRANRKGTFGSLGSMWDKEEQIEELEMKIKKRFYQGKPTRLQRRVDKLSGFQNVYAKEYLKTVEKYRSPLP